MKKTILIFIVLFFSFIPLSVFSQKRNINKPLKKKTRTVIVAKSQVEDGTWKELSSEEGKFKILFPTDPEKLIRDKDFTSGNSFIEYKLWTNYHY